MAEDAPPEEAESLMAMLKRRGFIQPAYGAYGGVAGFYDYGPLGQGLKRRFEDHWREHYVIQEGFGEVSTPTIAPEPVFRASGHLDQFDDVLIECPDCHAGARADHLLQDEYARLRGELEEDTDTILDDTGDDERARDLVSARNLILDQLDEHLATVETEADEATIRALLDVTEADEEPIARIQRSFGPFEAEVGPCWFEIRDETDEILTGGQVHCLACGEPLVENARVGPFNLMFATRIGPGDGDSGYMRPETAQGLFVNMPWLYRYNREQIPFGAVQIGRAYRNEIAPRQGLIRLREFWQAEAEVFVDPDDKTHPHFEDVARTQVHLVPAESDALETTLADAVNKGIIANQMVAWYIARTQRLLTQAGVDPDRLRFRQHESDEMAHYAADCWDAEFESIRYDWVECVGIADRGCYDLEAHQDESGDSMEAFRQYDEATEEHITRIEPDMSVLGPTFKGQAGQIAEALREADPEAVPTEEPFEITLDGEAHEIPQDAFDIIEERDIVTGERFLPHVIEPSYGIDRILYAILEHAWDPDPEGNVLHLPAKLAPLQVGVLPLVSKDGLPEKAREIEAALKNRGLVTYYDDGGSIGRRYARLDEVGTPYAITVDHETLEDDTVTLRDRDTQVQIRLAVDKDLPAKLEALIQGRTGFDELA